MKVEKSLICNERMTWTRVSRYPPYMRTLRKCSVLS